jgi:hypothetical protein
MQNPAHNCKSFSERRSILIANFVTEDSKTLGGFANPPLDPAIPVQRRVPF